jgi:hypothetical protein
MLRYEGSVFQWDHLMRPKDDSFAGRVTWSKVNEDGSLEKVSDSKLHVSLSAEWQRLDRVGTRTRLLAKTA